MKRMLALMCALLLAIAPLPVAAGGSLEGRIVTLNVETWRDDMTPFFTSRGRTVTVGSGVEFALLPEGAQGGFDVVPVQVEITQNRIEFSYGADRGIFWDAPFNGYILRFAVDCALFEAVAIDEDATTMPVTSDNIRTEGGALFINVAGMAYGPDARLSLDFRISECLLG